MRLLTKSLLLIVLLFISACDKEEVTPDTRVMIDGKLYETVIIGTQIWTSVNYSGAGGVNYDAANSKPEYGKYYSKAELAAIVLPEGWRLPTQQDYLKMTETAGITVPAHIASTEAIKGFISTANWNNVLGTNNSGFNAQPAGYSFRESAPIDGDIAEFWTSDGVTLSIQEAGVNLSSLRMAFYKSDDVPDYRFNVRFVKD
jgi:uncharacterized protein (TIGR02145 family)